MGLVPRLRLRPRRPATGSADDGPSDRRVGGGCSTTTTTTTSTATSGTPSPGSGNGLGLGPDATG
jgi:hypothetical protein